MKPTLIPCVTRSKNEYDVHLFSPSKRKALVRARKQTIIDCLTYGLQRNMHLDPIDHYNWYVDFVAEHQKEEGLVFVAPDCDWLEEKEVRKIGESWLNKVHTNQCLKVPETFLFPLVECVGHALKPHMTGPTHPDWTHSFSSFHIPIVGDTKRWTYDRLE